MNTKILINLDRYPLEILRSLLNIFFGLFVGLNYLLAIPLTTGSLELNYWDEVVISNHNALFFANLMLIAGFGGYLSSKVKRKDLKIGILAITYSLVFLVGFITQNSLPFRF